MSHSRCTCFYLFPRVAVSHSFYMCFLTLCLASFRILHTITYTPLTNIVSSINFNLLLTHFCIETCFYLNKTKPFRDYGFRGRDIFK